MEITKKSSGRVYKELLSQMGLPRGIKTADQPVLLDVPDSLDVVDGFGGVGLDQHLSRF
jgi:hypothetical protein